MPYQKPFIHVNNGRVAVIETPDGERHEIPAEHLPPGSAAGQFVDEEAFVRGFNERENSVHQARFTQGLGLRAQPIAQPLPQMPAQDPRPLAAAMPPQFRPQRPWQTQQPMITPAQPQTAPTIVIQQPPAPQPPATQTPQQPPAQPQANQLPQQASPVANTMNPRQQSAPWATPAPALRPRPPQDRPPAGQSPGVAERGYDDRRRFDDAFRGPR